MSAVTVCLYDVMEFSVQELLTVFKDGTYLRLSLHSSEWFNQKETF